MDGRKTETQAQYDLVRQIGFAERWLARAREEVAEGQDARGVLSLLLAEAEVHHARERTLPVQESVATRPLPLVSILGGTLLAGLLLSGLALRIPSPPVARWEVPAALSPAPPIIRFKQSVGSTLALIPVVVAPIEQRAPASIRPLETAGRAVGEKRPVVRPAVNRVPVAPAAAAPAAAPVLVSDSELIDLVLAAERSLRGVGP